MNAPIQINKKSIFYGFAGGADELTTQLSN